MNAELFDFIALMGVITATVLVAWWLLLRK